MSHILLQPKVDMPLALAKEGTEVYHTAGRTSSTSLNHVRGPSSAAELDGMKEQRAALVLKLQTLNREIADLELLAMIAS